MNSDYQTVQEALKGGADPALLCATCPWDRHCVTPPVMTAAEVEQHVKDAAAADRVAFDEARLAGRAPGAPEIAGTLLALSMFGGRHLSATVCPVFALRLRSSGGRRIADTFKGLMQAWDDQK
jgi:hypothetical protein